MASGHAIGFVLAAASTALAPRAGEATDSPGASPPCPPADVRLLPADARRARFALHGFGPGQTVYLHYVSPTGRVQRSVRLGIAGGRCGMLLTAPRPLFAFRPAPGTWTLQLDARRAYLPRPGPPDARIQLAVVSLG